jgi:hypothetical protein
VRSVKSGASAHSRSVRCPRSSALASAVLPKPQGALKKKDAAALHNAVKFLLHRWLYQNISVQF